METRKMLAMCAVIKDFCLSQFAQNGFGNEEAALVMDSVNGYFQKVAYDRTLLTLITREEQTTNGDDNKES